MTEQPGVIAELMQNSVKLVRSVGLATCFLAIAVLLLGFAAPLYFDKFIAILIILGGLARIYVSSTLRKHDKIWWPLVAGVTWTAFGTWALISNGGVLALALFMIFSFFIEGAFKALAAASLPRLNVWLLVLGVLDMAIGAILYFQWPVDAATAIPFLVAINLISTGMLLLQFASAISQGLTNIAAPEK